MTDEYNTTTDLNGINTGADAEAVGTSKDEQITTTVHETGYESECSSSSSSRSEEDITRSALEIEADAFTRFIERQRLDVMFELRRLRLGERPVTGQPNRERIATFLNNIQENQQEVRVPSTRPARPSAHIADINSLSDRRCVSAALSSTAFRQDLENTIRRTIGTQPLIPAQPIQQAPSVREVAQPAPIEQQNPQISQRVFRNSTEQRPQIDQNVTQQRPQIDQNVTQQRPQIDQNVTQQRPQINQNVAEQQPPQASFNIGRQERELDAWQAITQLQRETIVLEISDLVHRQLVTSALESDFRAHLEHNVLNRLEQGAPAEQQQGGQQQPIRPRVVQPPPAPLQVPRTNARAAATNIEELSTRLDTMQQMLQLMFTMQMDMQRSLRQDVASALASNSATTMNSAVHPMHAGHCTVCLTAMADTVLYRCGHLCVCYMCGLQLQQGASTNNVKCPICRAPVEDILRVYKSSRDGE